MRCAMLSMYLANRAVYRLSLIHISSDAPVAAEEPNDDGVDVKDPAQRAATVESVSASDFKAVAAAQGLSLIHILGCSIWAV